MRRTFKVVAVVVAAAASAAAANAAQAAVSLEPSDVVSELSSKTTARDALPAAFPLFGEGPGTVTPGAERLLASEGKFRYWVTSTSEDKICLVALDVDGAGGINCLQPKDAETMGLAVSTATPAGATEVYLVPDGTVLAEVPDGLKAVGNGVLLADPGAEKESGSFRVGDLLMADLDPLT